MPRIPRLVVPNIPHHCTQRGIYKQNIFRNNKDKEEYLFWIKRYSKEYEVKIWSYCLMDNHVHYIVVPKHEYSLSKMFNVAHMNYTQYLNKKLRRNGPLWESRFYSCPLDDEHLYEAVRYVEKNPVKAGIVREPENYKWSSANARIRNLNDGIITKSIPLYKEIMSWKEYLLEPEHNVKISFIKKSTKSGRPAGNRAFIKRIEKITGRNLKQNPVGRPKK